LPLINGNHGGSYSFLHGISYLSILILCFRIFPARRHGALAGALILL
jgi:hypothetical protein